MQRKNNIRLVVSGQTVAEILPDTRSVSTEFGSMIQVSDEFALYDAYGHWVRSISSKDRGYINIMNGHVGEKVLIKHLVTALMLWQ